MRSLMLVVPLLAFSLVVSAAPADAPKRKSGLWETKVSTQAEGAKGRGMPTIHECVDQKTDDLWENPMPDSDKPACSKKGLKK